MLQLEVCHTTVLETDIIGRTSVLTQCSSFYWNDVFDLYGGTLLRQGLLYHCKNWLVF